MKRLRFKPQVFAAPSTTVPYLSVQERQGLQEQGVTCSKKPGQAWLLLFPPGTEQDEGSFRLPSGTVFLA